MMLTIFVFIISGELSWLSARKNLKGVKDNRPLLLLLFLLFLWKILGGQKPFRGRESLFFGGGAPKRLSTTAEAGTLRKPDIVNKTKQNKYLYPTKTIVSTSDVICSIRLLYAGL